LFHTWFVIAFFAYSSTELRRVRDNRFLELSLYGKVKVLGGMHSGRIIWMLLPLLRGLSLNAAESSISPGDAEFFEKQIRPVLVEHCYKCHSAQAEKIKGGLLLDTREGLLKGGDSGEAIVAGDPDKSRLIIALRHTDKDLQMPPKEKLSDQQIADFERWVKIGAPDPRGGPTVSLEKKLADFWPAKEIAPPTAPLEKNSWIKDPIDAFVLVELNKHELKPVAPADKRALIRRACLDLIGLPPSAAEMEAFVADNSRDAFEKVVDHLLDSPHFGERWGRHWLDVARYADSNGLDLNTPFDNAWRYRDYVINAFNKDKPFNQFIIEQVAGDLLPSGDKDDQHEKWIATGFLVLGPKNFAEPNREKLLMDVVDEQIDVTCRSFMGLTVGCARCHDHKFDPIPTKDYYALAGIFKSTATLTENRPGGQNGNPWSERPLADPEQTKVFEEYQQKLTKANEELQLVREMRKTLPGGIDSKELEGIVMDNLDAEVIGPWTLSNYSTNFVDKNYLQDGNTRQNKGKTMVRFVPKIPQAGPYEIRFAYTPRVNRATNVPVRVTSPGGMKTIYLNEQVAPKYDKAFETLGVFNLDEGTNNIVEVLTEGTKGFVVVDAMQFLPQDVQVAAMVRKKKGTVSREAQTDKMMAMAKMANQEDVEYKFIDLQSSAPPPLPMAMAVREGKSQDCRVNIRGEVDKLGDVVPRGFISVLKRGNEAIRLEQAPLLRLQKRDGSGRLELAQWIASPENPLTPRVMANRIWQHLFGRGLVTTPDNFGVNGEKPSHPELLDYLAATFVQNGWSTKKLIRKIMLSSAYQMSSAQDPTAYAKDPENRWIWRMNRKRIEGEILRDSILAVNATIDLTLGGNSLTNQTGPMPNPAMADVARDSRRRSVYLPVLRGNVPDILQAFDFPDPHAVAGKRHVTTAPTQALLLMNSPFINEQATRWADQLLDSKAADTDLIERAYISAYGRPCTNAEKEHALKFISKYAGLLSQTESDPTKCRKLAWKSFCQALYESTEFRFVN
jgi:hypothetical protein